MRLRNDILRALAVLSGLGAVTALYRDLLPANPATVALTFLVLVLITAAFWGFRIALLASLTATALFNFFFLPPYGTFTIADPQNWVTLFAFLTSAVIASNLAERARKQKDLAEFRRSEVERLYALSQQLLTSNNTASLIKELPNQLVETFGGEGVVLLTAASERVYQSSDFVFDREQLERVNTTGEHTESNGICYFPLRIGTRPAGALAIKGASLSRESLEAIGSLIGIALERTQAIDELTHTRAEQESEKLRTALLDSVTHEFRTPLTSIKASVTGLLDAGEISEAEKNDLLTVIDEEADRLNRLVGEATEMAQLHAQQFTLDREVHGISEIVEAALQSTRQALQSHAVSVDVNGELNATLDADRIEQVLIHLLENAAKYSPPGSPIRISAEQDAEDILIHVADEGIGIDPREQHLVFEKYYRGEKHRLSTKGTGMGLAISKVIVEAHGGRVELKSQVGAGSVFTLRLPAGFHHVANLASP